MSTPTAITHREVLPIPEDVQPDHTWTSQMIEMADHIGPFATISIIAAFGGQRFYIPQSVEKSPFLDFVSPEIVATIAHVYGHDTLSVPVGRAAVSRARRAPILAAVRAGSMTTTEAGKLLGTSRTYLAYLVNQTDEAAGATPAVPARRRMVDPRQIDMFSDHNS